MINTSLKTLQGIHATAPCFYDTAKHVVYKIELPDAALSDLDFVDVTSDADLLTVPKCPGNYWILTNEPVHHCLHKGAHVPTPLENGFRVVYNGVSASSLRTRMKEHLLRTTDKGGFGSMSGISLDLLQTPPSNNNTKVKSHAKYVWSETNKRKVPKISNQDKQQQKYIVPTTKEEVLNGMPWSEEERAFAQDATGDLYFKNGIHAGDAKHAAYTWRFAFAPVKDDAVRNYVEDGWRKLYGTPVLCSYKKR